MAKQKILKGKKAVKGQSMTEYGEIKNRVQFSLTPTVIATLDEIANLLGVSRSDVLEQLGRSPQNEILDLLQRSKQNNHII